ncbi:VirB3 family type IV secretion system protein [Pandoraea sp.]|uniref:VirB3 family type IV secretion system protein n=1 Tax=Pandoraea sp. TaxID=1883445 RepID=UPI0012060249|nr:VirB3 family type IV secretion system protein [Pandoraea sp.]TAL56904.1 MAG: type VI secretion protein [Pandoraea sp.]TAM17698.1 MAG: type VI secretion protein [Pandoraea sp.]
MALMPSTESADDTLRAQVRKSLLEHKLVAGADRRPAVVVLVLVFLFAAVLHSYWLLLAYVPIHLVLWLATRRDPDRCDIYLKYRHQRDYYEPRAHPVPRNPRPEGFGRGRLC